MPKLPSVDLSTIMVFHRALNLDSILKKQRHYFANKGPPSQGYGFSCGHVWMWELDYKESWVLKNWCFWTVVLEKTLESPLDFKEIQPVHPKGNQSWVFIGRTDIEAETPILWPPDVKNWLIGKDSDAGKDWRQEEKGTTDDEMVGWHHWLNGHEFGWTPGNPQYSVSMDLTALDATKKCMVMDRRPGVLQSMESPRVGHDWATELNWTKLIQHCFWSRNSLLNKYSVETGPCSWAELVLSCCPSSWSRFLDRIYWRTFLISFIKVL